MSSDGTASVNASIDFDRSIDLESLLAKQQILPFLGLTTQTDTTYPDELGTDGRRFLTDDDTSLDERRTLKDLIWTLPQASSGQLLAINEFVTDGDIDTDAIRDVDGLDVAALEATTGFSLDQLAANAPSENLIAIDDYQDIIDRRRLALSTLGYNVKFRWQIPTDSYSIVNPPDAYLPLIGALQQHGATDAFGWAHTRDWGGVVKMTIILPSFRRELDTSRDDHGDTKTSLRKHEALADIDPTVSAGDDGDEDAESTITVYGGIQTGYDFRGSQTVWAKPLLFFPGSGTVMYGVGKRYSRRHVGDVTDAAHERAHDRVPIMEWWDNIYDDLSRHTTTVDDYLVRARAIAINFEDLPYDVPNFYAYLGIPDTYAETASERAGRIAEPETRPTLWNLQLSLLVALDAGYGGSRASDTFQAYNEVAQQLLFQPGKSIQMAAREHDLQADADDPSIAPDQQTLSDALGEAFAIPGVEAANEADLSHVDAQRMQDSIQQSLDDQS